MSHRVTIDFENASIEMQATCDRASDALHEIDDCINYVKENAKNLTTDIVEEYIVSLQKDKSSILASIDDFEKKLNEVKALGIKTIDTDYDRGENSLRALKQSLDEKAQSLSNAVNSLTGTRIDTLKSMIRNNIFENAKKYREALINKANGVRVITEEQSKALAEISDISLREFVYKILSENPELTMDDAINKARAQLESIANNTLEADRNEILRKLKDDLVKNNLSTEAIDKIISAGTPLTQSLLDEIHVSIAKQKESEAVRKKAIKMILEAIKKQGFIFNAKQGIKLDRERNVVKIAVRRPDGKLVEFEVYLNGKFMYHFDGYDGMACTKDEQPFVDALEKVYGMKFTKKHIDWENPDRLQNKKMQVMNTNYNHNK